MTNTKEIITNLPETLEVDFQPYGRVTLANLKLGDYNGHPLVEGTVIKGTETSRLFQHTSTKSVVGQNRVVYGIKQRELDAGKAVRVAM